KHKRPYAWKETFVSLSIQLGRIVMVGFAAKIYALCAVIIEPYRLFHLPMKLAGHWSVTNMVLLFLCLEFVYYWFHRWSHEVRWMWATHAVHHSPNHMNFINAERLSWTGDFAKALLL